MRGGICEQGSLAGDSPDLGLQRSVYLARYQPMRYFLIPLSKESLDQCGFSLS